jgi:hypothetical protein
MGDHKGVVSNVMTTTNPPGVRTAVIVSALTELLLPDLTRIV